jgi:hypothetical protein
MCVDHQKMRCHSTPSQIDTIVANSLARVSCNITVLYNGLLPSKLAGLSDESASQMLLIICWSPREQVVVLIDGLFVVPLFDGEECRCNVAEALLCIHILAKESNWSKTSIGKLIKLLHGRLLPANNNMPENMHQSSKILASMGPSYQSSPACPNACSVIGPESADATECGVCKAAIYNTNGKAFFVLRHTSLVKNFQRLFQSKSTAQQLRAPLPNNQLWGDVWGALCLSLSVYDSILLSPFNLIPLFNRRHQFQVRHAGLN